MKLKLLFLFLLLTIGLKGFSASSPLDTLLIQLDQYLEKSTEYVDKKEARIAEWRRVLGKSVSDEKRYEASIHLFEEYKSYKYDSAYSYAHHSLQLAERLQNPGYIAESNGAIVFCLCLLYTSPSPRDRG